MADIEKVIKGINCHIKKDCRENACPYACVYACEFVLFNDALEMLKAQEKIINRLQKDVADLRDALSMTDLTQKKDHESSTD